ncbi:MAG: hypothetical protein R2853_12000 [Thermomicrobiales bacterium]
MRTFGEAGRGWLKVVADDAYIRESIVDPMKKIVKGYLPSMPPFEPC